MRHFALVEEELAVTTLVQQLDEQVKQSRPQTKWHPPTLSIDCLIFSMEIPIPGIMPHVLKWTPNFGNSMEQIKHENYKLRMTRIYLYP